MRKVFLLDSVISLCNQKYITKEIFIIFKDSDKSLYCICENDKYYLYRVNRITFIENEESKLSISKDEYDMLVSMVMKNAKAKYVCKKIYQLDNNSMINVYENNFDGLITLESENEQEMFCNNTNSKIDVSDTDFASDFKLINLSREEFESQIASIKLMNDEKINLL